MAKTYHPPAVFVDGLHAVPIDIHNLAGRVVFDTTTATASAQATLDFTVGPHTGCPIFDLRQDIDSLELDGIAIPVTAATHHVLADNPAAKMRVLARTLVAGSSHTLKFSYSIATPDAAGAEPIGWVPGQNAVRWDAWFSDLYPGRYREMWFPSNLVHDLHPFTLEIEIRGTSTAHRLITNGTTATLATNHWSISFPAGHAAHQSLFVLAPQSEVALVTRIISLPSGASLTVEVSRDAGSTVDLEATANALELMLQEFETTAGPYVHGDRFVAHIWSNASRSMEYAGATTSNLASLRHETFHSWWARGLCPLTGADGWIDEGWTQAMTSSGGLSPATLNWANPPVTLCSRDPFDRFTTSAAYSTGRNVFRGIAGMVGTSTLIDAMRELYTARAPGLVSTPELEAWLIERTGNIDIAEVFNRWVYGFTTPSIADAWLRDNLADNGSTPSSGTFWISPDIWVRHDDDGGTAHQDPEYGQDNWFYARVHNRGSTTLDHFVVTFTVKSFVGTEFVFPSDWSPFLAVAIGFNLAPGESQVVRARWRAADVPAPHTHGCMLAHVWTPADGATPGAHTWTSNNLVQRNLTIVDVEPNEVADIHLRVGSRAGKGGVARLEVVRPARFPRLKVELASKIPGALAALRTPASTVTQPPAIVLTEPAVAQLVSGTATQSLTLRFAAGSRIGGSGMIKRPVDAPIEMFHDDGTEVVSFPDGKVGGWGARLKRGVAVDAILRIRAPSNLAAGELANVDVIQRDVTGNTIGGLRVCLRGRHGVTHRA